MLNAFNEREQLERLHDRHKRFSLNVYDHLRSHRKEKLEKAKENLKKTETELQKLKEKLHP